MSTIMLAAVVLFGLTLAFAGLLGIAKEKLRVVEDPRIDQVQEALPAANCGGCGYPGCREFAKAVVEEKAPCTGCPVGGPATAEAIAKILGVEVVKTYPYRPVIHCGAPASERYGQVQYEGVSSCAEAHVVGVTQACTYGCLGYGDCVAACEYDAMYMRDGLPVIKYDKCTGCGCCVRACPRNIIEQIPFKQTEMLVVACSNKEPAKEVKKVCGVGCVGCSACARVLADVFGVQDNLAYLDYDKYEGDEDFEAAIKKCPADVLIYFGQPKPHYEEQLAAEDRKRAEEGKPVPLSVAQQSADADAAKKESA
ncbi:MAG: RnfABCDGE type electron transport complex subunit B [Planctomycetota bacterium]|nr:MAG: RnfABCDGE type electron transport complex subunit B [Planctomycetota bacterium]